MRDLIATIDAWRARGDAIALATVVKTGGATPRPIGAKMIVNARGEFAGSVSGGCVEGAVIEEAQRVIKTGKPKLLKYGIANETAWEVGLSCGGMIEVWLEVQGSKFKVGAEDWLDTITRAIESDELCATATIVNGANVGAKMIVYADDRASGDLGDAALNTDVARDAQNAMQRESPENRVYGDAEIFIDVFAPKPNLVIIGGVHTAIPLTQFAQALGFHVTIVDGRARFASRERFPTADEIIVEWPQDALARIKIDASTYIAILTHDPKFDLPALAALSQMTPPRYIGAMGSRATRAQHFAQLRAQGVPEEFLSRVHGPIGLNLGARTPEEIALAIIAEMVAVRHGTQGGKMKDKGEKMKDKR
ncbi:MAG: XdhC family protein [Chloroflexi bacterium]|nr:XdhC family protein [Chloroflexota bacterium]